jgi:hypothetical protein
MYRFLMLCNDGKGAKAEQKNSISCDLQTLKNFIINPHFVSLETSDLTLALQYSSGALVLYADQVLLAPYLHMKPNEWDILCEPRNVI